MVTDADKKAIAQKFLAGSRSRDWSLLRSIMTEDIVWSLPGPSPISGEASGVDAVIACAQRIVSYGLTFYVETYSNWSTWFGLVASQHREEWDADSRRVSCDGLYSPE
jgi:ketosteroid isomerase-like protein